MNGTKIILTRCQIFHLKCTKFAQIPLGAHGAPPDPTSWIWERGVNGRRRKGKEKIWGGKKRREEGKRRGRGRVVPSYRGIDAPDLYDRDDSVTVNVNNVKVCDVDTRHDSLYHS